MLVRFQRAAGAVWRQAHGNVFVLPDPNSDVVVLSGTGEDLWWLLAQPMTIDQAAHRLSEVYDVTTEAIIGDLASVVDDLAARGVLERG